MRLDNYRRYYPLAAAIALIALCWLTLYSVRETEFALVTQFGRPLYTITDAGLHAKWLFQNATLFDRRLRIYNPRPSEFLTHDKKNLVIESYVAWRIEDPKRFVETVGDPGAAEVVIFTVGKHVFAACVHGEKNEAAQRRPEMLALLKTAKTP